MVAENIEEIVRRIIRQISDSEKINEIGLDENLQDLGINSISFIKIVVALEKEFGIEFDDDALAFETFQTLDGIVSYISEKIRLAPDNK